MEGGGKPGQGKLDKWKLKLEGGEGPEEIGEVGVGNWDAQIEKLNKWEVEIGGKAGEESESFGLEFSHFQSGW